MLLNEKLQQLYALYPVLQTIDQETSHVLRTHFHFQSLKEGTYLNSNDCPGIIFILDGQIKVHKISLEGNLTSLYTLAKGDLCHESLHCFLECEPLAISGLALVDSTLAILPHDFANRYLLQSVPFLTTMYQKLYHKVHLLIDHKESLLHEPLEVRLLNYLHAVSSPIIYATHEEIAFELGSSREFISRKLKKLAQEGVVTLERGKLKLLPQK